MNLKNLFRSINSSQLLALVLCCFSIFAFYGCNKNDDLEEEARRQQEAYNKQLAIDTVKIKEYIVTKNLTNAKRSPTNSGIYYVPQVVGTGDKAVPGKQVVTHYVLRNLQGDTLDTSRKIRTGQTAIEPLTFTLGYANLIFGYQDAVSIMRVGDKTTFLLPSGVAYGTQGQGTIPPNSILIFDIELLQVKQ